jgi:hypothetical protein
MQSKYIEIDVLPVGLDSWQVRLGDAAISQRKFQDKSEAIARAKEIARNVSGCLVVHGTDGEVQIRKQFGHGEAFVY